MFSICLVLAGLVAIAIVSEQQSSVVEQAELIPVRVRETKAKN